MQKVKQIFYRRNAKQALDKLEDIYQAECSVDGQRHLQYLMRISVWEASAMCN
uniref:Phox domain-containing family protein n=1 Tax=Rhizophora mucronata TaxID=61149 RepID=A0A2P2L9W3_RHIMU